MDKGFVDLLRVGEKLCVDMVSSMLLTAENEVRPFLVFGWSASSEEEEDELSLMDAAFFHRDEAGIGKTLMMAFVKGALKGHQSALRLMSTPDGRERTRAPDMVFHVSEAWMVARPVAPGTTELPTLPEGESVSSQPDRQEVVMVQVHRGEGTCMGRWPLVVGPSGRKEMRFEEISLDGEFFGRLAIRPSQSD